MPNSFDQFTQEYRHRAEQLRRDAFSCKDPVGRTALLELAASWNDLALASEHHARRAREFLSATRH